MEHNMKLHQDKKIMMQLMRAASEHYNIRIDFIEKDYWISQILQELSKSKYATTTVFKGGTSLSKGYKLINRFSEDIDLAMLDAVEQSGNNVKATMRSIEKLITIGLEERTIDGLTSKGSRFRKSVYAYNSVIKNEPQHEGSLIVELNSFMNPYPYEIIEMESFITQYLKENNLDEYIQMYHLETFKINVLDARQTLVEKLVSLVRFSYLGIEGLSSKIRHFYDLYYLLEDTRCRDYVMSNRFISDFNETLFHDKKIFETPLGWQDVCIEEIKLLNEPEALWEKLASKYNEELSHLSYAPIPNQGEILNSFKNLAARLLSSYSE